MSESFILKYMNVPVAEVEMLGRSGIVVSVALCRLFVLFEMFELLVTFSLLSVVCEMFDKFELSP
jgi:hypothetical protein